MSAIDLLDLEIDNAAADAFLSRFSHDLSRDECWPWLGALSKDGYPYMRVGGRVIGVHRIALHLIGVEVPMGADVDHTCYRPDCVNPDHLEAVTHRENVQRAWERRRSLAG